MSIETRIISTTIVRGRISGDDNLLVDGRVEGDVSVDGDLTLHVDARIDGNIDAKQIEINGTVKGNITASVSLAITKAAKVQGDLVAPSITIADGALIRGGIEVGGLSQSPRSSGRSRPAKKKPIVEDTSEEPELPEGTVARKVKVKS